MKDNARVVTRYTIRDPHGTVQAVHLRHQKPDGSKTFSWQQPDGTRGLGGRAAASLPFYGSEQLNDLSPGTCVWVTEGEKATDALLALDIPAVGTVTGSSGLHHDAVLKSLDGLQVVVWADADRVGREQAARLLGALYRVRGSADGLFEVDAASLGVTAEHADAADWTPEGDALDDLWEALREWTPPPPSKPAPAKPTNETLKGHLIAGRKNTAGLLAALDYLGIDLRFNERSSRLELLDVTADRPIWEASDDLRGANLRERISDSCLYLAANGQPARLHFGRERYNDVMAAALHTRRVDPFKIWLDDLPPWDGKGRLDSWIASCFDVGTVSAHVLQWASRSVLMAAVWRADSPGKKHDEMVVLVGPQGVGKSTAWAWLLPPTYRRQWFSDGLKFNDDTKTKVEAIQGRVIVEAPEMIGSTRAEAAAIKAFLSRQDDGSVRLTYRRDPVELLRRCVIVGSTDDPRCLPNDAAGLRRFIPIPVQGGHPSRVHTYLDKYRDQLWAEAVQRVRVDKDNAYLPDTLRQAQAELAETYRAADEAAEDVIGAFLRTHPGEVTVGEIAIGVNWPTDRRNVYRMTTALKHFHYTRRFKHHGEERKWVWVPPRVSPARQR